MRRKTPKSLRRFFKCFLQFKNISLYCDGESPVISLKLFERWIWSAKDIMFDIDDILQVEFSSTFFGILDLFVAFEQSVKCKISEFVFCEQSVYLYIMRFEFFLSKFFIYEKYFMDF